MLLGVAIWMGVDRSFMTFIIGNNLYAAAVFIVLSCGAIIFFLSFLGCCGVVLDRIGLLAIVSVCNSWLVTYDTLTKCLLACFYVVSVEILLFEYFYLMFYLTRGPLYLVY